MTSPNSTHTQDSKGHPSAAPFRTERKNITRVNYYLSRPRQINANNEPFMAKRCASGAAAAEFPPYGEKGSGEGRCLVLSRSARLAAFLKRLKGIEEGFAFGRIGIDVLLKRHNLGEIVAERLGFVVGLGAQ